MVNWLNGTWTPGDKVKYYGSRPEAFLEIQPGLYWYSGLGSGTFFRPDGTMLQNCSPQEGYAEARRLGIESRYVDSFDHRSLTNVGG